MITRRRALLTLAAGVATPLPAADVPEPRRLRLGLITDVHKDVIHDADERLQAFVDEMRASQVDAIVQLGDFCVPKPANKGFLAIYDSFPGPRHHVLGNHDTDGGYRREQTVAFWGMPARHYSFDLGGFHFIILDANDRPPGFKGGYPSFIAPEQVEWLRDDLAKTALNTFVFSHQSLERPACITNQADVRAVLEAAKTADGKHKVAACFHGHWHIDHGREIAGIPYHHINSASYYWLGERWKRDRLDPELAKRFPYVALTAPYTKPLFTVLEIDPQAATWQFAGRQSGWLGPSPADLGFQSTAVDLEMVRPEIRARSRRLA